MPPKLAKKKPPVKAKKSSVRRRATNGQAKDSEVALVRLRQKFEKALNARNELLKQADAALRESKEQAAAKVAELESLLNITPIPIWIARTPDCRHITGNQAAADLIGAPLETNVSQTPGEHPVKVTMAFLRAGRKLAPHELPMQRAGASGQPVSDEFEMVLPDGRVKSLCGHAIPLKDAGGTVTGVIAAFADITERKQSEAALQRAHEMLEQRILERTAQLAEMNARLEAQLVEGRWVEDALRESEKRFSAFLDHAPNLAFVKGTDGRYLYANRKFEDVFHFERGSVPGKTDVDLFPRGQADQFQAHDRQVLESRQVREFEIQALHADGLHTSIVVEFPLQDATGQACAIGGIATDITYRKQAEAALREKEELTRSFLENSTTVAWMKDAEGRYVYLSQNCERRFGLRFEDWQGKTDFEVWPSDVAQRFRDNDLLVLQQNRVVEVVEEAQDVDGVRSWWLTHRFPYQDASGRRYVGGLGVEITERKQAEEELRRSETFINSVVENLPHMIFVKDAQDLRFVRVNKAGEDLLGYAKQELIGKNDYDYFPKDEADFFTAKDREVLADGHLLDISEEPIRTRDGTIRYLHTKKIPILDRDGIPQYLLGISEDITDRKRTEEELETRAGLSDFVAEVSLSLNLNEPLNLLLQRCVGTIITRLGSALARIWVLEPGDLCGDCHKADWCSDRTQCLHLQASAGLSMNLNGEYRRVPLGALKIGRIAQGAGAMVSNDILQDDCLPNKQWIMDNGLQSFAGFPLVVEGRVFGVLALFGREPLSEAMLQTVESVCYGVATSIARKRTEDRLRDNKRALTRSREELLELTGQLLTAQDDERKRIARDLHDDYNQRLAAVAVDLQVLCDSTPASMQGRITAIAKQVEALSDDIHDLAYHLHPSLLDDVGLEVALRDLVLTFGQRENIEVSVSFNQIPGQLPKAIAGCLYRVAQESLHNVAKHGKASEAVVALSGSRLGLGLSVRDTGKGFVTDQATSPTHQGLGLRSMQERLRLVNGVLNVQSRPGHGTKVCAWIPFSEGAS